MRSVLPHHGHVRVTIGDLCDIVASDVLAGSFGEAALAAISAEVRALPLPPEMDVWPAPGNWSVLDQAVRFTVNDLRRVSRGLEPQPLTQFRRQNCRVPHRDC